MISREMMIINKRRIELINKKTNKTSEEIEELYNLQRKMMDYVNKTYPLPFDKLKELEEKYNGQ